MKIFFVTVALIGCMFFSDVWKDSPSENPVDNEEKISVESQTVADEPQPVAVETQAVVAGGEVEKISASNESAAANKKIDWDNAPRFGNQIELVNYLNTSRKNLRTYLPVVLTNGLSPDVNELVKLAPILYLQATNYGSKNGTTYMLYEITNYPGERVAYAYTHGDTSFLTADERQLYNTAVQIVEEAKSFSANLLYQELYIHDRITERVDYYTKTPQPTFARFKMATGALLDGKANCQGYADAFYMLATMCGINADKINGVANKEYHVWNTVNFGDNITYFTDVTWDDASFSFADSGEYNTYIYFNAPTDVAKNTHQWFVDYSPKNIQRKPDGRYFYYTREFNNSNGKYFGGYSNSAEDALAFIAQRIGRDGFRMSWMCTPVYDARYVDVNNALNLLTKNLLPKVYGWQGYIKINVSTRGNYMFFTVDATPK